MVKNTDQRYVTLEEKDEKEYYFPCPVCGKVLPVEMSKRNKPYCTCNDCGVQLFVRGKKGIEKFKKLIGELNIEID